MKFIQFIGSPNLIETPNFNKIPVLEKLVLRDCINLRGVHPSIGVHKKLIHLCIEGCRNLRSLPTKLEMESLETLILSGCSKIKKIPEFGENMQHVLKLYLEEIAITKLPTSIGHLTGLVVLNIRDCKSLTCLPSTVFNLKLLKEMNISRCSKLEGLPEILGNAKSVEQLDVSGTAMKEVPSSNGLLKNLMLSFRECKSRSWYDLLPFYSRPKSPNPVGFSSLSGLCSLTKLNLSDCNLRAIPNDIGCLFSLEEINLEGNSFVCLPDSISRLCKLRVMYLENCTSLRSLPKLPLSIVCVRGDGCASLEMVPDLLKPNSLCEVELILSDCNKLADNQGFIDMFFTVIRKQLQVSLSLSLSLSLYYKQLALYVQGLSLFGRFDEPGYNWRYDMVIPGGVIPKWFRYQSMGAEVNIKEPSSHLCTNEWMGIAVCVVFCSVRHHRIKNFCSLSHHLIVNGNKLNATLCIRRVVGSFDHIWLLYFLNQYYEESEDIKLLKECEANEFNQIGIKIETNQFTEVKKCGFRMVYKKDIEDLNQTMSQSSNTSIIPYEDLGVLHHISDNSIVAGDGNIAKRTRDDYDGAGPSGEGSSNDMPNPKMIKRLQEFKTHGNSDCPESSE